MEKSYVFKVVWRGWFVGATTLFVPVFLLTAAFAPNVPNSLWAAPLIVPVIAALQGVMFGGIVILGLSIWPPRSEK